MKREDWLKQLKIGDFVIFINDKEAQKMLIRVIDSDHICMVKAHLPKSDLAEGRVVWSENGEDDFGGRIEPVV